MIEVDTFEHAGLTVRICAEEYIEIWKDDSYTRQEARSAAEYAVKDIAHERELAQEWAARGVVTITT